MKIGYIRVSTEEQNTARQEALMSELGVEQVERGGRDVLILTHPDGKVSVTWTDEYNFLLTGMKVEPSLLVRIAESEGIKYVPDACVGKTGTDAWQSQIQNGGIPTCLVSLPLRYMHTSVETIDLGTLENCARLLARFILELDESWEEKLCLDD